MFGKPFGNKNERKNTIRITSGDGDVSRLSLRHSSGYYAGRHGTPVPKSNQQDVTNAQLQMLKRRKQIRSFITNNTCIYEYMITYGRRKSSETRDVSNYENEILLTERLTQKPTTYNVAYSRIIYVFPTKTFLRPSVQTVGIRLFPNSTS